MNENVYMYYVRMNETLLKEFGDPPEDCAAYLTALALFLGIELGYYADGKTEGIMRLIEKGIETNAAVHKDVKE